MSIVISDPRRVFGKIQLINEGTPAITATDRSAPPLVIETYVYSFARPTKEPQEDRAAHGGGSPNTSCNAIQVPISYHHCLRYERFEGMKARRRLVGDNGGIKFQGKIAKVRTDGCTNTITNVLKDNLILESDERIQRD